MTKLAGTAQLRINGQTVKMAGEFTYNLGADKNTGLSGPDGVHGHKSETQIPFIEGEIRNTPELRMKDITSLDDGVVTLSLANKKTIVLTGAWWAGDGTTGTAEAKIKAKWEGMHAEER